MNYYVVLFFDFVFRAKT